MPAVRIENVAADGSDLLVTRFRRDTANTEPESLIALCELSQGESRVFEMAASEVVTVMEIDARVADICGEQLAQLRASRAGNHIEPPTFAHQLAHFRATAHAYEFERTQEELEHAMREEAKPCANAN